MNGILNSAEMQKLSTTVEEATRSTEEGVKYFVEPAGGSLRRAVSRRHHIVFGRRGSGKSSLLRKAAADLTVDRKRRGLEVLEFWKAESRERLRRVSLVFSEAVPSREDESDDSRASH